MKRIRSAFAVLLWGICAAFTTALANPGTDSSPSLSALIEHIKKETEIDKDRYPALIQEVEAMIPTCNRPEEAAILHSLVAEMYASFERENAWKIRQRTPIVGYVPSDINEWTANLFEEKIKAAYARSLQPAELLQEIPISRYAEVLDSGKDERLRPTLFDYLLYRVLEVDPTDERYQLLIDYKRKCDNGEALMLAELEYLDFKQRDRDRNDGQEAYLASLDSLYTRYAGNDYAAAIWERRIETLVDITYRSGKLDADPINEAILALCQKAIETYPNYTRIGFFQNKLKEMQNPEIQVSIPAVTYPDSELQVDLRYKNLGSICIKVYKTDLTPEQLLSNPYLTQKTTETPQYARKLVRQARCKVELLNTYQYSDTLIRISGPEKTGIYEYEISVPNTDLVLKQIVCATELLALSRSHPNGGADIWVTDLQTGRPIEKATVLLYTRTKNGPVITDSIATDDFGIATVPVGKDIHYFRAVQKNDQVAPLSNFYSGSRTFGASATTRPLQVALFTDRGLYRPGQTVWVKGIVYSNEMDRETVISDRKVKVILRDANRKEVATQEWTTNAFGSFHGEFTLPKQGLNGNFTLSAENTTVSIQVEAYKRPSFLLAIDRIRDEIAFGDTVRIQGKAMTYSGVALTGGKLTYQIKNRPFRFAIGRSIYARSTVAYGETMADENGNFHFEFVPERPREETGLPLYASYEITATYTDSKGETQATDAYFSVGDVGIVLTTDLPARVKNEQLSVRIKAQTINNEPTTAKGRFILYAMDEVRNTKTGEVEQRLGKEMGQGEFTTETPIPENVFADLPSGRYRLCLTASDSQGRPVEWQQEVVLFADDDKRPPVFSPIWMTESKRYCAPEEHAEFSFGTSFTKTTVLYEVIAKDVVVARKRLELSDEIVHLTVPFLETYGEGVTVLFSFTKAGKLYSQRLPIYKKRPNKTLTIRTETFRDRLTPGSQESWSFHVLTADSLPATAELLASMYDASLDAISPFSWSFSPIWPTSLRAATFQTNPAYRKGFEVAAGAIDFRPVPSYAYPRINWEGALLTDYDQIFYAKETVAMRSSALAQENQVLEESMQADEATPPMATPSEKDEQTAREGRATPVRTNFEETAFFFPALRTDSAGRFVLRFTLPETNTTWKLQTFAHTKAMDYGLMTKEVVSSKPLMVVPNLPRFVRRGDEVTFSTQVMNRSEELLSGRVRLELFNPATDEPLVCLTKSQVPFRLESGEQTTAQWTVAVPEGSDLLGVRIVADTDTWSDGEQHLLPVLNNEVRITESKPFYLKGAGEKEIAFPQPGNTAIRSLRQTLEISANPVWYAVQALSDLTNPRANSASDWFATYYTSTLASYIVRANPRIHAVIQQWSAAGDDASSLQSNLEKNEELKQIVLEETPWVLEAENETEQIRRLSLLFDLNRTQSRRDEALYELVRLQREDGAWGWFSGFGADRHVTTHILQGMADLVQLQAVEYGQEEKEMQMNALKYLDRAIRDDFEKLKKQDKNWKSRLPNSEQLDYILMRSAYRDIPESVETREAIRFYTDQAETHWEKLPIRMRVQTALLLYRNGKKREGQAILSRFIQTATKSDEQGVFWANNRREGYSPVSPIETHTLLMNTFLEMQITDLDIEGMKQWLLNQKRVQSWETTPATMNAIYTLLLSGKDLLNETNRIVVRWGTDTIDTHEGTAGIGYRKQTRQGEEIRTGYRIRIQKTGDSPAWGALYQQYFAPADQVKRQAGDLSVDKQLFRQGVSEKGTILQPLKEGETFRVGEKIIVRLTLRAKQEMSYVHLKDMRAGCCEPAEQTSGTSYRDGVWFYRTAQDAAEHFYFDRLPRGTFVIEYATYVSRTGTYTAGPAEIQCLYAPEFTAHTDGGTLIIKD